MKKNIGFMFAFIVFSVFALFGQMQFFSASKTLANVSNQVVISKSSDLKNYITNYDSGHVSDNIVLAANIDMAGVVVNSTIGTESAVFCGSFDGKGYKISNLTIDISESDQSASNSKYCGLFGIVDNATIKNIEVSGNLNLKTGNALNLYAGGIVGKATNSQIQFVQMLATMTLDADFSGNTYFGGVVGSAINCNIDYIISRSASFGTWNLTSNNDKLYYFGGVAGNFSNSELSFAVVSVNLDLSAGVDFSGDIKIGGIVGSVSQGGSKLQNIAIENNFSVSNLSSSTIKIGEIAGTIENPSPNSKNIAYIHYKANNGINRFGDMGFYIYNDGTLYDYITPTQETISQQYFENQVWNPLLAEWDFQTIWYVGSSRVYLQSFYGNFNLKVSSNLDTTILSVTKDASSTGYRYGDSVKIGFSFNDVTQTEGINTNMSQYYSLSAVLKNGTQVAKIVTNIINGKNVYRISGSDFYEIENNSDNDKEFVLVIKSVNSYTMGDYDIKTDEKAFVGKFETRLFKDNQFVENSNPGYVFYAEGSNTTTEKLTLSKMTYGQTYRIESRVKPNSANIFEGWFLKKESGDVELGRNRILEFIFGAGEFVESFDIYAKYNNNACIITFKIDGGVSKVDLYSGYTTIEDTGANVEVSKEESSLKIEIFILEGYEFNVEQFIVELDTYKTDDPAKTFCSLRESYVLENGIKYFHFSLDMTTLQGDFANAFNINIQTLKIDKSNNSWIWYVVGGAGGVLLIAIVILIVVLIKRRGGGFGGGKKTTTSISKKNYKNMYY